MTYVLLSRRRSGESLLGRVGKLLCDYLQPASMAQRPVVKLRSPSEIEAAFSAAGCPLMLAAGDAPVSDDTLLAACHIVLDLSVHSGSPWFYNQLYGRAEHAAVAGDWVAAALNCAVHTYEVAPVMTVVEKHVFDRVARAIGSSFVSAHDGLLVPGGSIANLYGMHLARHRFAPSVHEEGCSGGPRLCAFVSEGAHYSYLKSARLIGLGSSNLISVKCDPKTGGMDPAALAAAIEKARADGRAPFLVGATAGTTVRGAYDPLRAIRDVCASQSPPLWLHVDAAWGGGALFSAKHRAQGDGVELADSLAWSAHKQLGAAQQCAVFITRHPEALRAANSTNATYLFQPDKLNAGLDAGDKTIQCGRRADMLKLWMLFKQLGDAGCARIVDAAYELKEHLVKRIEESDGALVLAYEPQGCNVCFWYVPKAMRPLKKPGVPVEQLGEKHPVHAVAPKIKAALQRRGEGMVGFLAADGLPNFFRWVFASPGDGACRVTPAHIDAMLKKIATYGEQ